jgi:hypothetical protein
VRLAVTVFGLDHHHRPWQPVIPRSRSNILSEALSSRSRKAALTYQTSIPSGQSAVRHRAAGRSFRSASRASHRLANRGLGLLAARAARRGRCSGQGWISCGELSDKKSLSRRGSEALLLLIGKVTLPLRPPALPLALPVRLRWSCSDARIGEDGACSRSNEQTADSVPRLSRAKVERAREHQTARPRQENSHGVSDTQSLPGRRSSRTRSWCR